MRQFFCILCDCLIFKRNTIFCTFCRLNLNEKELQFRVDNGVPHYYLYSWSIQTDGFCRKLAYSLKNKPSSHFIDLSVKFSDIFEPGNNRLVVPAGVKNKLNHSKSFAEILMKLYPFKGVLSVKTGSKGSQKLKKSRQERFDSLSGVFSGSQGDWVFVDDVFVTGATCYKIAQKLRSKPSLILTLFYKEKEF